MNRKKEKEITEINNCEKKFENLLEISIHKTEQSTIDCDFNLDFLYEYLHNLKEDIPTREEKVDENQSSYLPMAAE